MSTPEGDRIEVFRVDSYLGSKHTVRWAWRIVPGGHIDPYRYRYRWTAIRGAKRANTVLAIVAQGKGGKGWRQVRAGQR